MKYSEKYRFNFPENWAIHNPAARLTRMFVEAAMTVTDGKHLSLLGSLEVDRNTFDQGLLYALGSEALRATVVLVESGNKKIELDTGVRVIDYVDDIELLKDPYSPDKPLIYQLEAYGSFLIAHSETPNSRHIPCAT